MTFVNICLVRMRGLTGPSGLSSLWVGSKIYALASSNIAVGAFANLRGCAKDLCLPVKGAAASPVSCPGRHRREIGCQIGGLHLAVGDAIFIDVHAGPDAR